MIPTCEKNPFSWPFLSSNDNRTSHSSSLNSPLMQAWSKADDTTTENNNREKKRMEPASRAALLSRTHDN
jgi:hypothetical protein